MTRLSVTLALVLVAGTGQFGAAPDMPPRWAYPVPSADDGAARERANRAALKPADIVSGFDRAIPDHPSMPAVVAHGRTPGVRACASCHLPNGLGRPDNASLAGLPAVYIAQQMTDYRRGVRRSAEPRMGPAAAMAAIASAVDDRDVQEAGEYFASIAPTKWIRVVEADTVPRTDVAGGMRLRLPGIEPIGVRIVEVPEERGRDQRPVTSGYVAYVPVGSIKRGETLVTTGGFGKTVRCANCHGADLKGAGRTPRIAGQSPSYQARQLYDMRRGARHGAGADLMMATVARLTEADLVSIAAYTASREP